MANKNIFYQTSDGRIKEATGSYLDDVNNRLTTQKLTFNSASLPGLNGVIFSNNGLLSSSVQQNEQILAWDNNNSLWKFLDYTQLSTATTAIPNGSDVTGSFLTNATVSCLSNATSGTLPASRGGTGLNSVTVSGVEKLLAFNTTQTITSSVSTVGSTSLTQTSYKPVPIMMARFSDSSTTDQSYYQNTITFVNSSVVAAPAGLFGGNALYRTNNTNIAAYVDFQQITGDFTVEGWVYFNDAGSSGNGIARSVIFGNDRDSWLPMISASANAATSGYFSVWDGSNGIVTTVPFASSQWYHIALTKSGSNLLLYANATSSQTIPATNLGNQNISKAYVGSNTQGAYNVNGYFSEVAFYKYAKTASEISSYYTSTISNKQRRSAYETTSSTYSETIAGLRLDDGLKIISGSFNSASNNFINPILLRYY